MNVLCVLFDEKFTEVAFASLCVGGDDWLEQLAQQCGAKSSMYLVQRDVATMRPYDGDMDRYVTVCTVAEQKPGFAWHEVYDVKSILQDSPEYLHLCMEALRVMELTGILPYEYQDYWNNLMLNL